MDGRKDDGWGTSKMKDPWHLMPWDALKVVTRVLAYGAQRYEAWNWQKVSDWRDRYWSAGIRHMVALQEGGRLDEESGLPHWAHAICCMLFYGALEMLQGENVPVNKTRLMNGVSVDELAKKVMEIRSQEDELQSLAKRR